MAATRTRKYYRKSRGQALPIVGLLLGSGVLLGLIALALDGGSALVQRRTMQNAATSGALAGQQVLGQAMAVSCYPAPCHPTYLTTNANLLAQVNALVAANRGSVAGATDSLYSTSVEYHYMAGATSPCSDCYQPVPTAATNPLVPEFVDGIRVTAVISVPTLFAKALPRPIPYIPVTSQAAVRLYPTCASGATASDPELPLTRYRPELEAELADTTHGNSACAPLAVWKWSGDVAGMSFHNVISLNAASAYPAAGGALQLLAVTDPRQYPAYTLGNYTAGLLPPVANCAMGATENCAAMPGSGSLSGSAADQDVNNWIFWRWQGTIATTPVYTPSTMTYFPALAATDWGRCCGAQSSRPGDWAQIYTGTVGSSVAATVHDLATWTGAITPLSGSPFNWGRAVTATLYLWGDAGAPTSRDSQAFRAASATWEDVAIGGSAGAYTAADAANRVRLTRGVTIVLYENLQGAYGAAAAPGCAPFSPGSQTVWGVIPSAYVAQPVAGTCSTGWQPGGSVYGRLIDP